MQRFEGRCDLLGTDEVDDRADVATDGSGHRNVVEQVQRAAHPLAVGPQYAIEHILRDGFITELVHDGEQPVLRLPGRWGAMSNIILSGISDLGENATLNANPNPITAAWKIDKAREEQS